MKIPPILIAVNIISAALIVASCVGWWFYAPDWFHATLIGLAVFNLMLLFIGAAFRT